MADDIEDKKMPLLDHLIELRQRLLYSVVGLLIIFLICFYFANDLFNFLVQPLIDVWREKGELEERRFIFTALQEKFFTDVRIAFFTALFVSFPLIASQIWMFVAPGLYRNEKRAFLPFLVATPVLFFLGGAFVYYVVMPLAWDFFVTYGEHNASAGGGPTIQLEAKVGEYLSLAMRLIFAFGISFELPVVMSLLARVGMVSSRGLKQRRRYAIVLAFIAAAVLTPPDPLSQISLALPIIALYEISIISVRIIERKRGDDEEEWDDDGEPDETEPDEAEMKE